MYAIDYCQRLFLLLCSSVVELTDFHSHGLFQGSQLPCLECGVQVNEGNDQNLWWLYYYPISLSLSLFLSKNKKTNKLLHCIAWDIHCKRRGWYTPVTCQNVERLHCTLSLPLSLPLSLSLFLFIFLLQSPLGFYFVTGSHDKTARVWSTDHIQPLRILAGHLSDVDVCPLPDIAGNVTLSIEAVRDVECWSWNLSVSYEDACWI